MDYVRIPSPGTPGGPCRGSCPHEMCIEQRTLAERRCGCCGNRLGFGAQVEVERPAHAHCIALHETPQDRPKQREHRFGDGLAQLGRQHDQKHDS